MNKVQNIIEKFPAWILTIVTVAAILWLTLAPQPLGEITPPLFPGADKLVHAIMFGGLELMICLDYSRFKGWKRPGISFLIFTSIGVILFGALIEFLQDTMNLGRSADYFDLIADGAGTIIAAFVCFLYTRFHDGRQHDS